METPARFMVLAPTFLRSENTAAEVLHERGAEVDYEGVPGSSLAPLNAPAFFAMEKLRTSRATSFRGGTLKRHDRDFARHLVGLTPSQRMLVDNARTDFELAKGEAL